ncbi:DUF411 domain-containing protein [Luteimonas terricola]|uniref:DUF411 domain-containing protein n=1 Tax=Luteimonas terricola TaxID=645597 RepID=A0ABQ2EC90_9GAMM|nr:DUF411 domain-containing protein [Luteimonas terricola]GGK06393.1 hypothetical protein GCM10011394_14430 [Luteimonas terricola]
MNNKPALLLLGCLAAVAACSAGNGAPAAASVAQAPAHSPVPATDDEASLLVVHKHPSCGCCVAWIDHMREAGFAVQVHDHEDMGPIKQRAGVPYAKGSCHTAEIDGYFVEGHVPATDVKRLLAERPDARGLTVPGMPAGSPGMEVPDGTVHPYAVELVGHDGSTAVYARHGE